MGDERNILLVRLKLYGFRLLLGQVIFLPQHAGKPADFGLGGCSDHLTFLHQRFISSDRRGK